METTGTRDMGALSLAVFDLKCLTYNLQFAAEPLRWMGKKMYKFVGNLKACL